jgi:cytochrome c oxidase subunit II
VRRGAIVRLVALGVVLGLAATAVALFIPWLPEQASKEGERIDFVFWFVTGICIAVFAVVAAIAVYSVLKFRAPPDDDLDGLPVHGHTGIEIVWTVVPFLLVTSMAIVSTVALAKNDHLPEDHMVVNVIGRQFAWQFLYPPANTPEADEDELECQVEQVATRCVSSSDLRLPLNVPVLLRMRADDVLHSFWVPEFRQKQDLLPGQVRTIIVTPTKVGRWEVLCTELCGLGHSVMRSAAVVSTQAEFDSWLRESSQQNAGGGDAGAAVFAQNGCGSCHTLEDANATGNAGPNLEELPQAAERAGKPLEEFVRESIVEPDAYVEEGFNRGVMPKTYADLPDEQIDALVQYLVRSTREGGSR